ncbi:MAG: DUF2974 domain-containing protein [Kiritimatiellae bacterium]|nr:DUF2974 domain-containing protein [Kiritimatiellia bacterium]
MSGLSGLFRTARFAGSAAAMLAAVAVFGPHPAFAGILTGAVEEITSDLPPGATKVPVVGSGNSYEDCLSAETKQKVVTYGKLADSAYGEVDPPPGFKRLSPARAAEIAGPDFEVGADGTISKSGIGGTSGFNAMLFEDAHGNVVLGFRGTEGLTAPGDIWTDAAQAIGTDGKPATQYQAAAALLKNVIAKCPGDIVVTGHSLGGGLANFAMAANDLQGRVTGYTYNAAGLSEETLGYLERVANPGGVGKASGATINVRNEGDPVSYFDAHVGVMYEVDNPEGFASAHGIGCLVDNLETTQHVDGTKQGTATLDYQDPFTQAAGALANGLSAIMPADQAQLVAALAAEYAKLAAFAGAEKLDAKIAAELDRLEKRLQELMPGEMSSLALSQTIAALKQGDLSAAGAGLANIATGAAEDVVRAGLAKAGITGKEADAIVQGAKDAIRTAIDGGDVGQSIIGSVENYVYGKVRDELGQEAADAWKKVYDDIRNGIDPWTDLKDAALATATVKFNEFVDKTAAVIDARLAEMLKNHPVLADMFRAIGISGQGFADAAKWVWGVLTGPGSLAQKLETIANGAVAALRDMVSKLGQWALDKAKQYVNALISKVAKGIVDAVNGVIAKINAVIDKINSAIAKINGYIRKIKEFARMVGKISAGVGKILVDMGASASSAGVQLMQDLKNASKVIDHYVEELPTLNHVPDMPMPAIP